MSHPSGPPSETSRSSARQFTNLLLAGILVALAVIIISMSGDSSDSPQSEEAANPPIANPERIRETAQQGRTYRCVAKATFDAKVEDTDWGSTTVVNIGFVTDFVVTRHIESNDGRRIVELRTFETVRSAKLLTDVDARFNIGEPGLPLLAALDFLQPGTSAVVLTAKQIQPIVEGIASGLLTNEARNQAVKMLAKAEALEGKAVRITFEDGHGVVNVEEVQGKLTESERNLIHETAVLFDYHVMPDLEIAPGEEWEVDGRQFGVLVDPTWNGTPTGRVTVMRGGDRTINDGRVATLQVTDGTLTINASDKSRNRIGRFQPSGELQYLLDDGYVREADVTGELFLEEVSNDHLLFQSQFRFRPTVRIQYFCTME